MRKTDDPDQAVPRNWITMVNDGFDLNLAFEPVNGSEYRQVSHLATGSFRVAAANPAPQVQNRTDVPSSALRRHTDSHQ